MSSFVRENSVPVLYSVLLHGALVAALVWFTLVPTHSPVSMQSAPVNATLVDSQILRAAERAKAEEAARAAEQARAAAEAQAAAKAAAAAQAVQQATAARAAREAEEAQAASAAKAVEQAREAQAAKAATAVKEAQAAATARAAQDAKRQADARAAEDAKRQADAKAAAEAKAAADAKAAAEAKAAAQAKAAADAKAAAAAKAADEHARVEELRRQMAEEEHLAAVEASPLADRYKASLQARIQKAWIKPPSARVGIDCLVEVTQVPGGEVTGARVTQCNGDAAVRQSIENAVYRASPLPDPPDPALFQRNFAFRFKPDE
jgi:colicin import membrane protein